MSRHFAVVQNPFEVVSLVAFLKGEKADFGSIHVFCATDALKDSLADKGFGGLTGPSDYPLSEQEAEEIDHRAEALPMMWPQDPAHLYRGIKLTNLVYRGFVYFFIWVLKQTVVMEKALKDVRPEKLYLFARPVPMGHTTRPRELYYASAAQAIVKDFSSTVMWYGREEHRTNRTNPQTPRWRRWLPKLLPLVHIGVWDGKCPSVLISTSAGIAHPLSMECIRASRSAIYLRESYDLRTFYKMAQRGIRSVVLPPISGIQTQKDFLRSWEEDWEALRRDHRWSFHGLALPQVIGERLGELTTKTFQELKMQIDAINAFFDKHDIGFVLVDEDVCEFNKTLVQIANQRHIPTMVVEHGITGHKRGFCPVSADGIAAWGRIPAQQLRDWGVPATKIKMLGAPHFDRYASGVPRSREEILERLGLSHARDKKIVLYPANRLRVVEYGFLRTKPSFAEGRDLLHAIVEAIAPHPEQFLIIKIHPGDKGEHFQSLMKRYPNFSRYTILDNGAMEDLLHASSVVVNWASTVGLEALMMDRPVVNVNLFGKPDFIPFVQAHAAYDVRKAEDIAKAIAEAVGNPRAWANERKAFLQEYCSGVDGLASQRVLRHVEGKILGRRHRIGAIVQARMSSRRLPGKVLRSLCGKPLLQHLLERVQSVPELDNVVVATSDQPSDDTIAELAARMGVPCHRGSLDNVLERITHAAERFDMDRVVRVTGDSLFIEPSYLSGLIRLHLESGAVYSTAKNPRDFSRGTTGEVVERSVLEKILEETTDKEDLEHVTWNIRKNAERFKVAHLRPDPSLIRPGVRLAIDEEADWQLAQKLFERLYDANPLFGLREILGLHAKEPQLFECNAHVISGTTYPELETTSVNV
jgi:spore coat polysaccharide biosynthesis protein SpsF